MWAALTIETSAHRAAANITEAARRVSRLFTTLGAPISAKTIRTHWYCAPHWAPADGAAHELDAIAERVRLAALVLSVRPGDRPFAALRNAVEDWYRRRLSRGRDSLDHPFDLAAAFHEEQTTG